MIVGFLALRFPRKTYMLCVLDISLCVHGLISVRILVEVIMYLTVAYKLLDEENHSKYLICI
jgi:hypothetical protein